EVTAHIRRVQTVQLGEHDRLDHGESLGRTVTQIDLSLSQCEAVEEFPGRVGEVEERRGIVVDEEAGGRAPSRHMRSHVPISQLCRRSPPTKEELFLRLATKRA